VANTITKTASILTAAILSCVLSLVAPAGASIVAGDQVSLNNYDFNNGGSMTAYPFGPGSWQPFKTFCAQLDQNLYLGTPYNVDALAFSNDSIVPRTLTEHTAWLYTAFLDDTLPNYVADVAHEAAVQYGVWRSMGYSDTDMVNHGAGFYLNAGGAKDRYFAYGWDQTPSTWSGLGNVRVAVLKNPSNGSMAQDILVQVPEPATMSLLVMGGLALLARRK
jgi:hypothetical protein